MDNKNNNSNSNYEVKKKNTNQSDNSSQSTGNIKDTKKSVKVRKKITCKYKCIDTNSNKYLDSNNVSDINSNNKLDLQLYKFSYADFVILSSTLAFAISENLNDSDIDILITFIGMVEADLALLRTRRGIITGLAQAQDVANAGEEGVIEATEATEASESVASSLVTPQLSRKSKSRGKIKKIKKRKVKKNNNTKFQKSPNSN